MREKIEKVVKEIRQQIEHAWSDDTAYENYQRPKGIEELSAGQCGPSSVVMFEKLTSSFPQEKFSIAVGRVYKSNKELVVGKHVWVVWHKNYPSDSWVIDITSDQGVGQSKTYTFQNIKTLAEEGVVYQAYSLAYSLDQVDEPPKRRAKILLEKMQENK